jgi:midasin
VPAVTNHEDLLEIIVNSLHDAALHDLAPKLLAFIEWFSNRSHGRIVVSLRDIMAWTTFMNKLVVSLSPIFCFIHGACLVLLDALGSGTTHIGNPAAFYSECLQKLVEDIPAPDRNEIMQSFVQQRLQYGLVSSTESSVPLWGTAPFFIPTGSTPPKSSGYALGAPTTSKNAFRVLRAMQLGKPILLEGSPGVGKTSLVLSIAAEAGHNVVRLNLSEQTDIMDLFGSDLPVEGSVGKFAWRDGPFLQALKNGDWVLLDELNLASQSVLEGLNACIDHREEVFVPELNRTFKCNKSGFRLFACQNPLSQGGGRKGLPKSFLNRFTQVYVSSLDEADMNIIVASSFPSIDSAIVEKMITFNVQLQHYCDKHKIRSSCGDFNLRDVFRWCELLQRHRSAAMSLLPDEYLPTVYLRRFRVPSDISLVKELYESIFGYVPQTDSRPLYNISPESVNIGHGCYHRKLQQVSSNITQLTSSLSLLPGSLELLESMIDAVDMKWMVKLVGPSAAGKTSLVRLLALLTGHELHEFAMNSSVDTIELLGGFEQVDLNRIGNAIISDCKSLISFCLQELLARPSAETLHEHIERVKKFQHHLENISSSTWTSVQLESNLRPMLGELNHVIELLQLEISATMAFHPQLIQQVRYIFISILHLYIYFPVP